MTARRLREWPRMIAAAATLAILLVLIGVVVASASSGGGGGAKHTSELAALRQTNAGQAARLHADRQTLTHLQSVVSGQAAQLAHDTKALATSRAVARCWQTKAQHPKRERGLHCAQIQTTQRR